MVISGPGLELEMLICTIAQSFLDLIYCYNSSRVTWVQPKHLLKGFLSKIDIKKPRDQSWKEKTLRPKRKKEAGLDPYSNHLGRRTASRPTATARS